MSSMRRSGRIVTRIGPILSASEDQNGRVETHLSRPLRVALAQLNSTVGDLGGNTDKIVDWIGRARKQKADLVVFPELALTGYPPEDLLLKPSFIRDNLRHLDRVVAATQGIAAVGALV